jgi:hypothetical protein
LKLQALESSIDINGAFYLVEKKKEREGRRRRLHLGWIRRTESTMHWGLLSETQTM